jgi:predicted transcriptional regulator
VLLPRWRVQDRCHSSFPRRDVYEALRERKAAAHTTVSTMMNILEIE